MKRILSLAVLSAFALTGCNSSNEEIDNNYPEDDVIRVTTQVTNPVLTRATTTSTYTGSNLALDIIPANALPEYTYENVWFTASDGVWGASDQVERHWQSASNTYTYYAYAPASGTNGTALSSVAYDLSNENIDLLWATKTGKVSELLNTSKSLDIVFDHMFAQLVIEVEIGNGLYATGSNGERDYSTCPVTAVTFTNATGKGSFDTKQGIITEGSTSSCTIAAGSKTEKPHTAATATSDGLFVTGTRCMGPGNQAVTVTITANGQTYKYTHTSYEYKAGYSYLMKVKVGTSGVKGNGVTVGAWQEESVEDALTNF